MSNYTDDVSRYDYRDHPEDSPIFRALQSVCPHPNRTVRLAVWVAELGGIVEERCTRCGTTWTRPR